MPPSERPDYARLIRAIPDFPRPGVVYFDVRPLLQTPALWRQALQELRAELSSTHFDGIAAIEAKGFLLGSALALQYSLPLQLIRKPGLTPGLVLTRSFLKEYGEGSYQLHAYAFQPGERVLIVYDIMAGAGASLAAIRLVEACGARVAALAYLVELEYLGGREELSDYQLVSLLKVREKPSL